MLARNDSGSTCAPLILDLQLCSYYYWKLTCKAAELCCFHCGPKEQFHWIQVPTALAASIPRFGGVLQLLFASICRMMKHFKLVHIICIQSETNEERQIKNLHGRVRRMRTENRSKHQSHSFQTNIIPPLSNFQIYNFIETHITRTINFPTSPTTISIFASISTSVADLQTNF